MTAARCAWEQEVVSYLASHPRVVFAFLFGSFANDRWRTDSDVDFAVHLEEPFSQQDVAAIWGRLESITQRDVDLVMLNTAPPGVAWAAMKGKPLIVKDPKFRLESMLRTSREAEDFREYVMAFLGERNRRRRGVTGVIERLVAESGSS